MKDWRFNNRIIISVDLDMWWHCRWATGSRKALWKDTSSVFRDYYGTDLPSDDLVDYTSKVLSLLEEYDINATFFVLGEIAEYFPELIKKIHSKDHEISCHGFYHTDASQFDRLEFRRQVGWAKKKLEDLTGDAVMGYRAPNLVLSPWIFDEILDLGFVYDSSICPSRKIFGKYGEINNSSNNPYLFSLKGRGKKEKRILVEIPIPSFPLLKLPACSGIMTRILGLWWTNIAIYNALRFGDVIYFFHPYEIGDRPSLKKENFYIKLFLRNLGLPYENKLRNILYMAKQRGNSLAKDVAQRILCHKK